MAATINDLDLHDLLEDGLSPGNRAVQHAEVDERYTESDQATPPAKTPKRAEHEEYEAKIKARMLDTLKRKAAAMGFQLSPMPTQ